MASGVFIFCCLGALIIFSGLIASLFGEGGSRVMTNGMLDLIFVLGLFLYSGTSGVVSFGQMGFALLGAYVGGILTIDPATRSVLLPDLPAFLVQVSPPQALTPLVAAFVGAVVAVPTGLVVTRLVGVAGSIGTFSMLIVFHEVFSNLDAVNGAAGVSGVPISTSLGEAMVWAIGAVAVAVAFNQSRIGLRLRASREDFAAARASGIDVERMRMAAWILGAAVSAAGGSLYAQLVGSFTPDSLYLSITVLTLAMLVVGGMKSPSGAVVGALGLTGLYQILLQLEGGVAVGPVSIPGTHGAAELGLAAVMLIMLIRWPAGVTGGRDLTLSALRLPPLPSRWRSEHG